MKVIRNLPDAAIAAQAGWSEQAITKMVATYAHAVDERRLDEIDRAFDGQAPVPFPHASSPKTQVGPSHTGQLAPKSAAIHSSLQAGHQAYRLG
jgi:hypothetical protein